MWTWTPCGRTSAQPVRPDPVDDCRYRNRGQRVRVRVGWSGETTSNIWQKVDVELEEEDLRRVINTAKLPEDLLSRLPAKICYQLLQNEAETMLLTKLLGFGYPQEKASSRIAELSGSSTDILTAIRAQLAPA